MPLPRPAGFRPPEAQPMRDWILKRGDPLSLGLAADARLSHPDYTDDQIWQLRLRGGEPPAVHLYTTYGLRARDMRLFPQFKEGDRTVTDPEAFDRPPAVHRFFPNYLLLTFSPFQGIDVVHELWVPESDTLVGRLRVINSGVTPRSLRCDVVAQLTPTEEGERMTPARIEGVSVLQGRTEDLFPLIFMAGGPQASSSPHARLSQAVELLPGLEHSLFWAHAARPDPEGAFHQAREAAARNWEAECARIELANASQVEISTGDPDWDAAFALGQKVALGLFLGPTGHLPHPSFVANRRPDQGHSLRGDGSDYPPLWNGQTALDAWYLTGLLLPSAPRLAEGLLKNFLAVQEEDGYVDWKPGLGGQRSRMDATPLLATLAWEIYGHTQDEGFLEEVFPGLYTSVMSWFSPYHDRDGDGIPEWDHPRQIGFEDHPVYAHTHPWSRGVDISTAEGPALSAFLYRECLSLIDIAGVLGREEPRLPLQAHVDHLKTAVEAAWDESEAVYRDWDRDTHRSPTGREIARFEGPGTYLLNQAWDPPARLLLQLSAPVRATRTARIKLLGSDPGGEQARIELNAEDFRWHLGRGTWTSERVFCTLDSLEVEGVRPSVTLTARTVDYTHLDHTQLLPLWAGIPDPERARTLLRRTITAPERFGGRHGAPACPTLPHAEAAEACATVWLPWNALLGEGMLRYDRREEAARLVEGLMEAIVDNLKREGAFRSRYLADTGRGVGERDALTGLPPLRLFLKALGVRLLSPWRVSLSGANPFPWPVEVKYRGLTVRRGDGETRVTFPNGETITTPDPAACTIDGKSQNR